ncbi:MAG: Ig-like domain-containing protein [Thiobacillaceae bacterium]
MRSHTFNSLLLKAGLMVSGLLLASGVSLADGVNLTAGSASLTLPDGSTVPMWGYSCDATQPASTTATCAKLNPAATGWSPVVITVPTGTNLTINLTNNLSFSNGNTVPTSLVIVGQLGGGLGSAPIRTPSPDHSNAQQLTWPIADPTVKGTPPAQGPRVQSFATEVAVGTTAGTGQCASPCALTWTAPKPGTYLIESGTHPSIQGPMGLYGILVVTGAPTADPTTGAETAAGTAYPGVTYDAEVPLLFSEIDPVQNNAVNAAVNTAGFSETRVWSGQPGQCGNPQAPVGTINTCYPPAVNYTPLYYLINGVAFDKTHAAASLFPASPTSGVSGNVLVRFVNAGLRMHVPSLVGTLTGGTAALPGFSLIAEDGNPLPGVPRVQTEVFMAAGKTMDVMLNVPPANSPALPVFDRELSLSGNATERDAGMLAYIGINGAGLPADPAAVANQDTYDALIAGKTLTVSDPAKGVIANDVNVHGVAVSTPPSHGTLTLNVNGTFTYVPTGSATSDSFTYCANGTTTICTTVTLGAATIEPASGIAMNPVTYTSNVATALSIKSPGILSVDKDGAGYPLTVSATSVSPLSGPGSGTLSVDPSGGFNATVSAPGTYTFTYKAQNSQGTISASTATVTLNFPTATGLSVSVLDGKDKTTAITDYRWIIEEDRTFYIDPTKTTNTGGTTIVPTFGTNFHTSYMPVVAQGCTGPLSCESGQTVIDPTTGKHANAVCDGGNGVCRPGTQETAVDPGQVALDATKRYYISILPGDSANPFIAGNGSADCTAGSANATDPSSCGHGMAGAPLAAGQTSVTILTEPQPFPTAKLSVFVFEDDFPLNGENDAGGGIDTLSPNEPGLAGFQITLFDDAGGTGDATGQITYDMFNMPLSNALAGTKDPNTGLDACPISKNELQGAGGTASDQGITGMVVTCPKYESDGTTLSPLAGQAVIANLYPGRYGVVATPAAERIAKGEEWLQTNTLDGQKAHDSFLRIAEPSYFQEYGPAGYHVSIGFANPAIINARKAGVCGGTDPNITGTNCTNTVTGIVTTERMSRTPDERLYSSGSNDSFSFTQCYVSFGDPDGEDFAFTKCNPDGSFSISGLPDGDWRVTVFDQWNDMLVDGLSTPVRLDHTNSASGNLGQIAINQWQANMYTSTFFDENGDGVRQEHESGLSLVPTNIRFRDGSFSNFNSTDFNGNAGFNEVFPLFSWYVIETDSTRYKNTGTHVVYDAGGPADGTPGGGTSIIGNLMTNTAEQVSVPLALRVPGAKYCLTADCTNPGDFTDPTNQKGSTGRVDPPWVTSEGWQGFSGQNSFVEFGKTPFAPGENGGIHGHVVYASTRPFDDPALLLQLSWEPLVPHVTINLYQEGLAADGITKTLKLVDSTQTSSWDDWAQGFRSDGVPNMNCPGQLPAPTTSTPGDLFFFSLYDQPNYLDVYNSEHGGPTPTALPNDSQFKCYDGMHNWNQVQPAPYDGMYQFPSIAGRNPTTGAPTGGTGSVVGTNCTICVANPTDNTPMLPAGKYVVEVVVPPGYELVKEEDKNILIGDNYIAPVAQQFAGLGNVFIMPDQAAVNASYNANNAQNPTTNLGSPRHEGDTGSVESFWPCVGEARVVPDYISLYPGSQEVAPFAGATRNLCDRKEVTLADQTSALAKFYIFTSTHAAAHFTGVITDDYTSEFDPFSPQFGEKFSPPDLPISLKDWAGNEISRVYSDHWGAYNGLTYSSWEVNPPNPTGYAPTMMVTCMNDPGSGATPDPLFNPAYSQFCYEIPFMPGQTQYMDTPVVPTSAFAGAGYNNADCSYPDTTPAISSVTSSDIAGPWVSAAGHAITITALGDQQVNNHAYSGPQATTSPFNLKTVKHYYGFGGTKGSVTIGGVAVPAASITTWTDTTIVLNVPNNVPACPVQQQQQYGGPTGNGNAARCGELVITAANGKKSVDAVTVTIGGKTPSVLAAGQTIQSAIDAAAPGDMIIVPPGAYNEILLMWKPVRLQGVGAASVVINANTHPAGKMDPWRRQVNCLFGLALDGSPITGSHPFDPNGTYTCPFGSATNPTTVQAKFSDSPTTLTYWSQSVNDPQIDRLPLEATVGWDANLNGNLAELLQEPSLMGALEGAAITVLSKGVDFHGQNPFDPTLLAGFPTGTTLLTNSTQICGSGSGNGNGNRNHFPSSFWCNPSSIDGLSITDSSQGGGGIFVHGWGHNIQIANNRIYNNAGTFSGGISVGQGEHPGVNLQGSATNAPPGSCESSGTANVALPYCFDMNVNIHHNAVTQNSSLGDELFSATPAGAGGVSFASGSDYYTFSSNWVCGNLGSGDGGGLGHIGFSKNGDIEHNAFLFNQSTNPTIPANGGGLIIMGAPDVDPPCGATTDADCVPADLSTIGPSDGVGPGLKINANLIMGNQAESGSGGGIAFQSVNGSEVVSFPTTPSQWYSVSVTNNIIANNVAGWDGAGISLLDALNMNIVNNTIMSNDSTASSGVLFNTIGAPLASTLGSNCTQNGGTTSCPQPAGLVSIQNSAVLQANLPTSVTIRCPTGHYTGSGNGTNGNCRSFSVPLLYNDVFWQNRSFDIGVGALGAGTLNQQNVVALYDAFTSTLAPSQPQADATTPNGNGVIITGGSGACTTASYWDIGARGDTGPTNHSSTLTLAPTYSVLTDITGYNAAGLHNSNSNPTVVSQYCNGSRVPPEGICLSPTGQSVPCGWQVPPGIADATVPNPIFNLTPAATVDEGNNWINISWGPLTLTNPTVLGLDGNYGGGDLLGNYAPAAGSPLINAGISAAVSGVAPPSTDFFGTTRTAPYDIGAVEFVAPPASSDLAITKTDGVTNVIRGSSVTYTIVVTNNGPSTVTGAVVADTRPSAITAGSWSWSCAPTGSNGCGPSGNSGSGNINKTLGTLASGASVTFTVTGTISSSAAFGNFSNSATVTAPSGTSDPNTSNNNATDTDTVVTPAVSFTGESGVATLNGAGTTLSFGNRNGSVSDTVTLTIGGTASVTFGTATVTNGTGTAFSKGADSCSGNTFAVGATCTITVNFNGPTGNSARTGTLTVPHNGTGSPATLALTGS